MSERSDFQPEGNGNLMDLLYEKDEEIKIIKKDSSESSFEIKNKSLDEIPEEEVDWRGNKINQNQNQKQLEHT